MSCNGELANGIHNNNNNNNNNNNCNNIKIQKKSFTDGINVCVWLLCSCLLAHIVVDNYTKYGVVRNPIELTRDFIQYMQTYWWLYLSAYISYWVQLLSCFLIEKLLIWKKISERTGLGLHIFNSMLILNVIAVLTYSFQCSPFAGINIMGYSFFQCFKYWSYTLINRKHRLGLFSHKKHDDEKEDRKGVAYPENVTLGNLTQFIVTTTILTYNVNGVKRKPRDFKKAAKLMFYIVILHYLCAFMLHQYVIPDVKQASQYILEKDFVNLAAVGFKLVVPIFTVWLLYFYFYCFQCYMALFGCVWGTEDADLMNDWWNAETTTVYWAKWNIQVHNVLKDCIFVPLLKMGYNKRQASVIVSIVSGILHEYLLTVPCRTGYGIAMFGMLTQIPFAFISTYLYKNVSAILGNLVFWVSLIIGEVGCFVILYYKYNYNNSLTFLQIY